MFIHPINSKQNPKIYIKSPYNKTVTQGGFYGLGIDPLSSEIYVADAIDFVQTGWVYHYLADKTPVDTFSVGIIPGAFCFKEKK